MLRVREIEVGETAPVKLERLSGAVEDHIVDTGEVKLVVYCTDCGWENSHLYSTEEVALRYAVNMSAAHKLGCGREEVRGMD